MNLRPETDKFLKTVALHTGKPLAFPHETGALLERSAEAGKRSAFAECVFHAKFAVNTFRVMRRIGMNAEGYEKLQAEFAASIDILTRGIRALLAGAPAEVRTHFEKRFLEQSPNALTTLLELAEDLAAVKNWEIDGNALP